MTGRRWAWTRVGPNGIPSNDRPRPADPRGHERPGPGRTGTQPQRRSSPRRRDPRRPVPGLVRSPDVPVRRGPPRVHPVAVILAAVLLIVPSGAAQPSPDLMFETTRATGSLDLTGD